MGTVLNPYLSFRDNAREAMQFYHTVFGGKLTISTFKDFQMSPDPSEDDKIMHSMLVTEHGLTLMGADTPSHMEFRPGTNGSISLSGEDEAELRRYWGGLVEGATVTAPLDQSPWGDTFGMLTDKYGVNWMVNIAGKRA